jgi:ferric-dicitrate binding protein FerR (iron transport regulator)
MARGPDRTLTEDVMQATTTPIDREVLLNMRLGDEHALERLFRSSYPQLADRARAELDDPSCAPRVVEGAFLRAWAEREHFETPEELERFLQRSVHEGAVREKTRRASLHRFEQREGIKPHPPHHSSAPVDVKVDDAWAHMTATLHAPPTSAAVIDQRHVHSRHEAAVHMASVAKRPPWVAPLVTALVLGAIFLMGMRWMDRAGSDAAVNSALNAPDPRLRMTRAGEQAALTLTDETRALLGGDSRLRIPKAFGTPVRAVALEGTASFTPSPNAERPFHVRTEQAMLTATGTKFDVRSVPGESRTLVRVREGTVRATAGGQSHSVAAGEALDVRADGTTHPLAGAALTEAFAWADGRLVVNNRPLREALTEVQRAFGLTLNVPDARLLDRPVTANVELGATRALIAALEQSGRLKFDYENQRMVLRDAAAP